MLRFWPLVAICVLGLVLSVAVGLWVESIGIHAGLATLCATIVLSATGVLFFRLHPFPAASPVPGPTTSVTAATQRYLRWLIREVADYRIMLGTALTERAGAVPFPDLFCDINVYGFNQRRLSLSRWLSETRIGKARYGAILLGPPGSGKSVTLQAILLACANASYLFDALPNSRLLLWIENQLSSSLVRFLFDRTWILPAPPLVPVLIRLGSFEHYFSRFCSALDPDIEKDLLVPILTNVPELSPDQFRSLLAAGRLAILFDGLDELRRDVWRTAALELVSFLWARGGDHPNLFLVTCRNGSFSSQLRDVKPAGFGEVVLEQLTAEDKRAIVTRIIEAELRDMPARGNSLLSGVHQHFNAPVKFEEASLTYKPQKVDLLNDLLAEIVDRVPQGFTSWKPADYPLSLRRMTTVLLSRSREHLQLRWDIGEDRPHWRLDVGLFRDSVLDYTNIIEEDLREFLSRRNLFAEVNKYPRDEMLRLYGELAYGLSAGSEGISEDVLRIFVAQNTSSTQLTSDQAFEAFCAPGIISEVNSQGPDRRFAFRDVESAEFLAAFYMVTSRDPENKIDAYLSREPENPLNPPAAVSMAFARLRGDALKQFVERTRYFSVPPLLASLIGGLVGTSAFGTMSEREAEVLLARSLEEVSRDSLTNNHLRPWQLIRYIIFNNKATRWSLGNGLEFLESRSVPSESKAQMILVLAELTGRLLDENEREVCRVALMPYLHDNNPLVRSCSALALDYLGYDRNLEEDPLWVSIAGDYYLVGDPMIRDNPEQRLYIPGFSMARFPVLRFQYQFHSQGDRREYSLIPAGDAFKPMVGMTVAEADAYAIALKSRLPTSAEFEVVSAYHGETGRRRVYPWGDEFGPAQLDVALERSNLRLLVHDLEEAASVAMKPALATPGGVYDLVSNVWQLTSDRSPLEQDEPEIIMFGPPLSCDDQDLFRCVERSPVPAERIPRRVGFRLAR